MVLILPVSNIIVLHLVLRFPLFGVHDFIPERISIILSSRLLLLQQYRSIISLILFAAPEWRRALFLLRLNNKLLLQLLLPFL